MVWGSNDPKVGHEAWERSKGGLPSVEQGREKARGGAYGIIQGRILGASLDRELGWERDVGLLSRVDLGPVHHGVGSD